MRGVDPLYALGVAVGVILGTILQILTVVYMILYIIVGGAFVRLMTLHRREVVAYNAIDQEYGPVRVVVTANRLTGRMRRRVYARDP